MAAATHTALPMQHTSLSPISGYSNFRSVRDSWIFQVLSFVELLCVCVHTSSYACQASVRGAPAETALKFAFLFNKTFTLKRAKTGTIFEKDVH